MITMHQTGMNTREIADHLNAEGVLSSTGKVFYPALVFATIRKAKLRQMRTSGVALLSCSCIVQDL